MTTKSLTIKSIGSRARFQPPLHHDKEGVNKEGVTLKRCSKIDMDTFHGASGGVELLLDWIGLLGKTDRIFLVLQYPCPNHPTRNNCEQCFHSCDSWMIGMKRFED